jgi:hypothetical protein
LLVHILQSAVAAAAAPGSVFRDSLADVRLTGDPQSLVAAAIIIMSSGCPMQLILLIVHYFKEAT